MEKANFIWKTMPAPAYRHHHGRQRALGAESAGFPAQLGHKVGAETFRRIATCCKNLGLDYLTVYAFSTENWKRSADEVRAIMAPV